MDINRMTKDDFRSVGLPDNVAKNVVEYRDKHDGFKSIDELSKVPGVTPEMLSPIRDRLGMSPAKE
jgi:DNA uptake protein ComE-like DNA-binding protein